MNIMNRRSISGNNTEQELQSQIADLQDNIVATGTNLGVGPDTLNQLTTGTNNIAIGSGTASGKYGLTTGSGNMMLGVNSGLSCITSNNNTFLGYNTSMYGASYINGSVALGAGATITSYYQLMVASNVTQFNIPGLAASTGTGVGTILEFDLAGNILPMAGTYKTVLAIGTVITTINAPYAMSWVVNSEHTYDGSTSVPLPFGTHLILVILPIWQPRQLGHALLLVCGTLLLRLASV